MSDLSTLRVKLNDGTSIPQFVIGTPDLPEEYAALPQVLKTAISLGFRAIDTAWFYGCEPYVGQALAEVFKEGIVKREDLHITTKVWPSLWNNAEASVKKSLSDLGIDYADLVLQHWPICFKSSGPDGLPKVPRDADGKVAVAEDGDYLETYKQLVEIQKKGLAKSIGVSNYAEKHIQRAIDETGVVPAVLQIELHPRLPSLDLVKFAESKGIRVQSYSPLGHNGVPLLKEPLVLDIAEKYNVGPAFILYAYHLSRGRLVVTRTSKLERIKSFKQTALPTLSTEELAQLDQLGIDNPKRFIRDDWLPIIGLPYSE